jgi:hypothetical protein
MLKGRGKHRIGQAAVANDAIGSKAHAISRRNHAAAPIAKHIAVGRDLDRWAGDTMTSGARVKCVPSTMIIGVGCGKS